jgi:CMP-N-acetylneuraminic acid synthetase
MAKPLGIIPARGNSKRFPRKNLALLGGKPLVAWTVETAVQSGVFDSVCVSSEDPEILKVGKEAGADRAIVRPQELSADTAQTKHVCLHLLQQLEEQGDTYESFALLMPTCPTKKASDIRAAYDLFVSTDCDSVMSFVRCEHPPQMCYRMVEGKAEPFMGVDTVHRQSQNLEPLYRHDGAITFVKTDVFLRRSEWCDTGVAPYIMPPGHSVDIDTPQDLAWAEFVLAERKSPEYAT